MRRLCAFLLLVGMTSPLLADDFTLDNVVFQGTDASLTLDRIDFKNASLKKEEAQKLFSASTTDDEKAALWAKLKADSISIPKIEALVRGGKVTFYNLEISKLEDNKMARLALSAINAELVAQQEKQAEGEDKEKQDKDKQDKDKQDKDNNAKPDQGEKKQRAVNVRASSLNAEDVDFNNALEAAKSQDFLLMIPQMGKATFGGGEITVEDDETPKDAVGGNLWRIRLASADSNTTYKDGLPLSMQMAYKHLALEPPPSSKAGKGFASLGYDKLDFSFKTSAQYDPAARSLTMNDLTLEEQKSGALSLKGLIGAFDKTVFTGSRDARIISALNGDIANMTVRFDDSGLVNKIIGFLAPQQKQTIEEYKKKLALMTSQVLPLFLGADPSVTKLAESLNAFIAAPKNISLSLTAKKDPVKFTELMSLKEPQKFLTLFNLESSANEP